MEAFIFSIYFSDKKSHLVFYHILHRQILVYYWLDSLRKTPFVFFFLKEWFERLISYVLLSLFVQSVPSLVRNSKDALVSLRFVSHKPFYDFEISFFWFFMFATIYSSLSNMFDLSSWNSSNVFIRNMFVALLSKLKTAWWLQLSSLYFRVLNIGLKILQTIITFMSLS